jgi:hypothetical protein
VAWPDEAMMLERMGRVYGVGSRKRKYTKKIPGSRKIA